MADLLTALDDIARAAIATWEAMQTIEPWPVRAQWGDVAPPQR